MVKIHPTAVVDPQAELGREVEIGPYCVVGPQVKIGDGTRLHAHVCISGPTTIGKNNQFHNFGSIGGRPQDQKFQGEESYLVIGDDNFFGEYVDLDRGTEFGGLYTRIGHQNWFMAYVHIAHDCQIGDHTVIANAGQIGGHVEVQDHARIGGMCAVHQFCRVGSYAMVEGHSAITHDVPPFSLYMGKREGLVDINREGLRRQDYQSSQIDVIRKTHKKIFQNGPFEEELFKELVETFGSTIELEMMFSFIRQNSGRRAIYRYSSRNRLNRPPSPSPEGTLSRDLGKRNT